MIEKSGDENLLKRKVDDGENVKEKKKKKKIAKSYLDDLWIINIKKNKCNKFLPNFVTNVPLAMCILDFFCWNIRFGNNLCLFTKSHFFISSWKNLERHCEVMSIMINHNLTRFFSSPIACVACERTELLKTEITPFCPFRPFSQFFVLFVLFPPSKLFLVFFRGFSLPYLRSYGMYTYGMYTYGILRQIFETNFCDEFLWRIFVSNFFDKSK